MLKKNDLFRYEDSYYRVIDINEDKLLVIDCVKRMMPFQIKLYENIVSIDEKMLPEITGKKLDDFNSASATRQNEAYTRYSVIASALSVITNKNHYTKLLNEAAERTGTSKQTLRKYLCNYLVFQDLACLLPAERRQAEKELSPDEKNYRWALNKWFYNQNRHTLRWTYQQMLRECYCDPTGKLLADRPTFDQFRYFYRKHKKEHNYLISRNGIGDYKRNNRPLLGDCIQTRFPNVGTGMLDGTVCDIYLVNQSGNVVGRPLLTACIDANTSLCCGYCLSWEGGTYNLRNLMFNVIADKVEWCKKHNIIIDKETWPCLFPFLPIPSSLPWFFLLQWFHFVPPGYLSRMCNLSPLKYMPSTEQSTGPKRIKLYEPKLYEKLKDR